MKKTINTNQIAFDFTGALATPAQESTPALLPVMSHMADRLHAKLEMMLQRGSLDESVSLVIKQDDRDALVAAIDGNNDDLTSEQRVCLETIAQWAIAADHKVYLSYDHVEQLFSTLRH